jgi:superfamily II DNA or RNA helicase
MNFNDLEVKQEYRSPSDDVVRQFYIPVLQCATSYKRSVGFFSSTALEEIAKGICNLAKNGGTIDLVASPHLSEEDMNAIQTGYENRAKTIENALLRSLNEPSHNQFASDRLNMLANLIEQGILNIRIAFTENGNSIGIYHEKLGLIEDSKGNKIVFSGSMNESENAMRLNYETVDVFCSWKSDDEKSRVLQKEEAFARIWGNYDSKLHVLPFPAVDKAILAKYKQSVSDYDLDREEYTSYKIEHKQNITQEVKDLSLGKENSKSDTEDTFCASLEVAYTNYPKIPTIVQFYPYQQEAIEKWSENNFCGIFDMATGTGKTLTGLGAITVCAKKNNNELAVIIVVPYQHLVEQWVEDIVKFNIKPIIGFSSSPQKNWKQRLDQQIQSQNILSGTRSDNFMCFICTNATFSSDFVQKQIAGIKNPKLLVVDEAHNFGAPYLEKLLYDFYEYRLALSATIDRYGDKDGTQKLYHFFGKKCISYDIKRAIVEKKLTKYNYYPVIVTFTGAEQKKYLQLTNELKDHITTDKKGNVTYDDYGKILLMNRSNLIAGATEKVSALKKEITPYKNDSHILVYCGTAKILAEDSDISAKDKEGERQIVTISKMLGNELGIKCHHFTSNESVEERALLKNRFTNGDLQCLVAIKCLDEGVNIPSIRTAFILASTTNPKEYIQRRGRVLRLAKGKTIANIYDFLTLPFSLELAKSYSLEEMKPFLGLVRRELKRAYEFSRIADNYFEADEILDNVCHVFGLKKANIMEGNEKNE